MTTVTDRDVAGGGLAGRMLGAWADLRGSMRAELDRGVSEGRLLFYAVLSGLIWFLGRAALLAWGPIGPTLSEEDFRRMVGTEFISAVFYRTLALYVVAAIVGLVARRFGGTGGWQASRAAVFWGALVAAPVIFAATLVSILLTTVPGRAAEIASMLGALASAWALAHCIAEAHGFASPWRVLAVIGVLAGGFVLALVLLGAALGA